MDELKDAVRVVCLSETYDSMLMWSHYARNHTGYCIEYEFNKDDMYYSSLHHFSTIRTKNPEAFSRGFATLSALHFQYHLTKKSNHILLFSMEYIFLKP